MATRFINKVTTTAWVRNYGNAAGWGYTGGKVYVNGDGVARALAMGFNFGQSWFVDKTNGATTNDGKDPGNPLTLIQTAITNAADRDMIFIAPGKIAGTDTDPNNYTEALTIPAGKRLALIGTGGGPAQGGQPQIKVGSGTAAQLTIRSAGSLIYGLSFNGGSATGGGILLDDDGGTGKNAFGVEIADCFFKLCVGSTATSSKTGGAIQWPAVGNAWQVRIIGNRFYKNVGDVVLIGTSSSVPQDVVIQGNIFSGPAANVDCNLYLAGGSGMNGVIVDNNVFTGFPALGSGAVLRFIDMTGCVGIVSNNVFASNGKTFGASGDGALIPTTVFIAGNHQEKSTSGSGEIFRT